MRATAPSQSAPGADVRRERERAAAERLDLGRGPLRSRRVDLCDRDVRTLLREGQRDAAPDPAPRSRHEGHPPGEAFGSAQGIAASA